MREWKKGGILVFTMLLSLLLSGCMFTSSPEDMYELPQFPDEYAALRNVVDDIVADGAEYAAPLSGTNVQSVQMVDLDGDGVEEAVAFFRNSADEKPLKIYIFRETENGYEQAALLEGSGAAVHSIGYQDLNDDGCRELLVGWRVSADIQAMEVYDLVGFRPQTLMFSMYSRYEVLDFDEDGMKELVVLRSDMEGNPVAEYYDWDDRILASRSAARLTMTMAELKSVEIGTLRNGGLALFVTGVSQDTRAITDIIVYKDESIYNIVRDDYSGVSSEIFRNIDLLPTDIDGDGVTEVPMPVQLESSRVGEGSVYWQVYWRSYNEKGQGEVVCATYHNTAEGWYVVLPDAWDGKIAVRQSSALDERGTVFSMFDRDADDYVDIMGIYTITGSSREYKAVRNDRFVLKRQADTVYSAVFFPGNEQWKHAIDQEELNQRFRLIVKEWDIAVN